MSYEDKMRKKMWARLTPEEMALAPLLKGEKIDLTKNEQLFYQFNRDRIGIEKQVEREKYDPLAKDVSDLRQAVDNKGWTKDKTKKLIGFIPNDIYFTHPWFSPNLSKKERDENIQKFFQMFPKFRI